MTGAEFFLSLLSDLIAEGMSTFVSGLFGASDLTREDKHRHARWPMQRTEMQIALQKGSAAVGKRLDIADANVRDRLRTFLVSPEAEAVVRHVLTAEYARTVDTRNFLPKVREEFFAAAERFVGTAIDEVLLARIFESVTEASRVAYAGAKSYGLVSSDRDIPLLHARAIERELAAIEASLRVLRDPVAPLSEILEFEAQYRQQAAAAHASIVPPHLDRATPVPIGQLFVPPALFAGADRQGITLNDLTETITRSVVLGNPGGGKSTLAQHICHRLATSAERLVAHRRVTPVLIVLREYGMEKKNRPLSIVSFIENMMAARYQVQPPRGAIDYLLASGRLLVVFDGLDELIETSFRRDVVAAVQSFCNLYGAAPVLVTSREVGYEQAPLDSRHFTTLYLAPFDEPRVRQYAEQWFALDDELTPQQKRSRTEAFLRESQSVADLRTNPLMLGLLCNIYRGENHIPQNRPDVYQKCAVMLFERWDEGRGIKIELTFRSKIRPALTALAHWIYSDPSLQAGVRQARLVGRTRDYLLSRRFEDPEEALEAATQFVEFCRGRAWVFTDTGSTSDGEPIYQFTHRTFLEFFTAEHIVRSVETTEKVYGQLRDRIARQEWDMVSQLAFQLRNRVSEDAADYLLEHLADEANSVLSDETWNLVWFGARCLEFLVPIPRVTRKVIAALLQRALDRSPEFPRDTFRTLYRASAENRDVVIDEAATLFQAMMRDDDRAVAKRAAWALLALDADTHETPTVREAVVSAQKEVFQTDTAWYGLAARYQPLAAVLLARGFVTPAQAIGWHGLAVLYEDNVRNELIPSLTYRPFAVTVPSHPDSAEALANLGETVIEKRPSMLKADARRALEQQQWSRTEYAVLNKLPPDALFGLFCVYAPMAEIADERWVRLLSTELPETLTLILQSRRKPGELAERIGRLGFDQPQRDFISRWATGSSSLIR